MIPGNRFMVFFLSFLSVGYGRFDETQVHAQRNRFRVVRGEDRAQLVVLGEGIGNLILATEVKLNPSSPAVTRKSFFQKYFQSKRGRWSSTVRAIMINEGLLSTIIEGHMVA
jgi:hypothetical protein